MRQRDSPLVVTQPLFWDCKYARLCSERTVIVGATDDGHYFGDICLSPSIDLPKFLMLASISEDKVLVPGQATFGGVWINQFVHDDRTGAASFVNQFLQHVGNRRLEIILPPTYFYPDIFGFQSDLIRQLGGRTTHVDISYHIELDTWSLQSLSKGNRKKLRQCDEQSVSFSRLPVDQLEFAYELISDNRERIGVTPSTTLSQLQNFFFTCPNKYHCFGVYLGSDLIAAAITVMLSSDVRYVYMWADNIEFRSLSPVVALCVGIADISREQGIRVLDLGTASQGGIIDEGLSRFKRNLGALSTEKPGFYFA